MICQLIIDCLHRLLIKAISFPPLFTNYRVNANHQSSTVTATLVYKTSDCLPSKPPLDSTKPDEAQPIDLAAQSSEQAIQIDFHQILMSFVSERKKMWQSILSSIERVESTEAELERILGLDEQNDQAIADEKVDAQSDEEAGPLDRTFTKAKLDTNATYENSMLFDSTSPGFPELNNSGLIEPVGNSTPIPKKLQRAKKRSEKRRTCTLISSAQSLPTVF
ncbi:hypothetical protein L1887_55126 [Cichorium endivia]|nr:hypothetical protein L1887_55126 [Cichorium endivia]